MLGTGSSLQPEWDFEEDTILEPTDVNFDLSIGSDSAALAMSSSSLSEVNNEPIAAANLIKGNAEPNDRPTKVCSYCICIPNKAMHPITIMSIFILQYLRVAQTQPIEDVIHIMRDTWGLFAEHNSTCGPGGGNFAPELIVSLIGSARENNIATRVRLQYFLTIIRLIEFVERTRTLTHLL